MFKRIAYEDWTLIIGIVSFVLVSGVFLIGAIKAIRMPKAKRDHLASLPLDEAHNLPKPSSTPPTTSHS